MTLSQKVVVSREGPVTTIRINRPERRNAVDCATADLLRAAFRAFEADESAGVAVLTGADGHFCAGYDLKSLADEPLAYNAEGEGPMGPTRMLLTKPTIAAIEGFAVAGGLEIALWCDLRIASASAMFGVYCRRWGVPLVDGGCVRLPRLIGQSRALDMILTGRGVGAEEALAFGLANRVVAEGEALATAQALALQLSRFPQLCLRTDRLTACRQWDLPLAEALRYEAREGARPIAAEAQAGAARFSQGLGRREDFETI